MWHPEIIPIDTRTTKYKIWQDGAPISVKTAFGLLQSNNEFANFLNTLLAESPFMAYFWEVKPVTLKNYDDDFEFVLVESRSLIHIQANKDAFQQYLKGHPLVTSFLNLGKDAKLIVPVELMEASNYAHLAKFVRNAPAAQRVAFWHLVASEFIQAIGESTKWLSTSGLGVYWLHVRIDSRPKYYNHAPYKQGIG